MTKVGVGGISGQTWKKYFLRNPNQELLSVLAVLAIQAEYQASSCALGVQVTKCKKFVYVNPFGTEM